MDVPVRNVCALVAYDGTDYYGFQVQNGVPTIQGALEEALQQCVGTFCRVTGSGRTDTGVHARGQVVAARVPWRHDLSALNRAWNSHLPRAIVVRQIAEAPEGFHPRFSAVSRTYRYSVFHPESGYAGISLQRFPLFDRFALVEPQSLNLMAMNAAATSLLGEHDFITFGQPPQGDNSVRRIFQAEWRPVQCDVPELDSHPLQQVVFTITANAFLRRMVRNIVGTLLEIGRGSRDIEDVGRILLARKRSLSAGPAPAQGLVLERVDYPEQYSFFS